MSNNDRFQISFSAVETFTTCERKYYYNYVMKLPRKFWPWLTFGVFNHLVLEKFHNYIRYFKKRGRSYDKKALMARAFLSSVKKNMLLVKAGRAEALTKEQMDASKSLLKKYFNRIDSNEPDVLFTERKFEIDLGDNIILRGVIDRIDRLDDKKFKILDYKTSKEAYVVDKNDQLAIYAIAAKQLFDAEDVELYKQLDFLKIDKIMPPNETGQLHDSSGDKELLDKFLKIGQKIRNKIATDTMEKDWKWKENKFCFCCDFKAQCYASRDFKSNQSPSSDFEFA